MTTAKQLLKEASASNIEGLSAKIEVFLQDVEKKKKLGHEETRLYSEFVQNCLHTFVMKLRGLKDVDQSLEIMKSCKACGRTYIHLQPLLEKDTKHVVSSLLYHVILGLQDNVLTQADHVVEISDLAYQILDAAGFPESSHNVSAAWHSCLWNSSSKLFRQGSSHSLKTFLLLRKRALLFLSSTPFKDSNLVTMFQYTITHYTQFNKDWIDKGTSDVFYDIFDSAIDKLNSMMDRFDTEKDKTACVLVLIRIQAVLVEYLLKVSDYEKARDFVSSMAERCGKCKLLRSAVDNYTYTITNSEALKTSQTYNISIEKLNTTNRDISTVLKSAEKEELRLLYGSTMALVQSFGSKAYDNLEVGIAREMVTTCRLLLTMCQKLEAESKTAKGKENDKKKVKDESLEYTSSTLQAHYKLLQFMHKVLEDNAAEDLCIDCIEALDEFHLVLEENVSVLPKKNENIHRHNISYVSSIIGAVLFQVGKYTSAANMYKITVKQLHKCQQPNLLKMFERLLECYVHLENWKEATQTVYQALVTVDDDYKQVVAMWTRQKREACQREDIFQSLTLNSVVKSAGKDVKGISSRQLLLAEYHAWKLFSRRQYIIEYHVLRELLDITQTPVQKAEVLVALAATLCLTGYNTDEMSAGEMLNRAIILFDKNLAGSESSLALACYTKYIVLHEEAIEYMKNETGELEYYGKGDISENARFTLQHEQENMSFLVRAIELWEKSLSANEKKSRKSGEAKKAGSKKLQENAEDSLFGLDHHLDNLIMCGTRLIAMKQPQLAVRALQIAKDQISNVKDTKRACDLSVQLSRALMLLGRFEEAETVVDGKGDNKKQTTPLNLSLILSELYMINGKRENGVEILQTVLDSNELLGKTPKVYLLQGTAKRLLSVALCLPGSDHMMDSANQYLLSLAFEAVQCHLTVINFLTKSKSLNQNLDKWLILNEVLSSLLHLCQLCRIIGLPREALCYLKAGLNISQGQGLPRWSCEFLMEMLGVQSMEAECEKALQTADSLNCILSTENQSKSDELNQSRKGSRSDNQSRSSSMSSQCDNENFGFQDTNGGLAMKMETDSTEKTPERVYVKKELNDENKKKMRDLKAPDCMCMVGKSESCTDMIRHRLCMKAGIVLSDFLAQSDLKIIAHQLLSKVQLKFDILLGFGSDRTSGIFKNDFTDKKSTVGNGNTPDPQLLYSYLEACCIKAEYYLNQKVFHKVHDLWKSFHNLEQSGKLSNVVHSNVLLTRLAICDAAGYMMNLHGCKDESLTKLDHSGTDLTIDNTAKQLERLSLNPRRKVSFESEVEMLSATGTSIKMKKKISKESLDIKTTTSVNGIVNTPKAPLSAKKATNALTTPSTSKINVANKIIEISDDEDDDVVFPFPKPVTPGVGLKSSNKSRVNKMCKTEPRGMVSKKPGFVIAVDPDVENKVACKLDFVSQPSEDMKNEDVEISKSKGRKSKKVSKEPLGMKTASAVGDAFNTPKPQINAKKASAALTTPSLSRMNVLDKLMESDDDEDDDIVFPFPKPVTPGFGTKSSKKSRVNKMCKTEPRGMVSKKPGFVIAVDPDCDPDNKVACKLDFVTQTSEDLKSQDVENDKSKAGKQSRTRKIAKPAVKSDASKDTDENEAEKTTSKKSRIPKSSRKSTAKTKASDNAKEISDDVDENDELESVDKSILKEKLTDNSSLKSKVVDQVKGDVFDFELEASPAVDKSKNTGKGKGKTKATQRGKKVNATKKATAKDETENEPAGNKENESVPKTRKTTRRGRANKEPETVEMVRGYGDSIDDCEHEISLEELPLVHEADSDEDEINGEMNSGLVEPNTVDSMVKTGDRNIDAIEMMRGKTGATYSRQSAKVADESVEEDVNDYISSEEETSNTSRTMEQMRSGRLMSLNDLDILDDMAGPSVACEEIPSAGNASPCASDIIPSLQTLYERLCQFPPSPQHSDVCHILALHYINSNPRRAAFLLSDAMAVTFRHQVMLNLSKKARREAKDSTAAPVKTTSPCNSIMFSGDEIRHTEALSAIPADWCVVQLSVVSVGLPCKQMILTRFVKDRDPVVIRLPGFSSPQGGHILKDFNMILEHNAETVGITSTSEWWSARRKLDTDIGNLVERMEKHWLGCWRFALLPGNFPQKIINIAGREVSKIVQKDVNISLLLMACSTVTGKELVQCVSELVGPRVQSSQIDGVIGVLKKYYRLGTKASDQQHTILILDKSLQHLPWESISILSDKSVSRMPCLSHVVMQLADHQSRKHSVFVKGVDTKNTFYILNPDSDLPRTQDFFKDWFKSEKDWSGVIGCRPTSEQFVDALTNKDFFIYCGHGSGGRIFTSDDIEKLSARAVTMLMGCSSGRLLVKGQLEPAGMMISYFLAGCPCMVSNLWDVTDKDIDKFTEDVIKTWIASKDGTYLPKLVQKSRAVCKLKYLNGLAPVVYGLPVFINKSKE